MGNEIKLYLIKNNFSKRLKYLKRKLKNKKIIIYGTGILFKYIYDNYDLSGLNIIGISDRKFRIENETYLGYKTIPLSRIKRYNPDYVLVATLKYLSIIEDFEENIFKNASFSILPLVEKKVFTFVYVRDFFRNFIYFFEFVKNLFKYTNKKIEIEKLQIWTGQTCTLKCKNCSQLFPYIDPNIYDIDEVIEDTKKILLHCKPKELHIIGGEPFVNKNIDKLIEFVAFSNPGGDNKIISNGTIIPSKKVVDMLIKYKDSIRITVSHYDCVRYKQQEFKKLMDENKIQCSIIKASSPWFYMGSEDMSKIKDLGKVERNFIFCWDRSCNTIADGILSLCPRMHNSPFVFREKRKFIEHLPIKKLKADNISRALIATTLSDKTYREACRHCLGVSSVNDMYCKRGEQL